MTTKTNGDSAAAPAETSTPDEVIAAQRNRQIVILTVVILVLAGLVAVSRLTKGADSKVEPVALVPGGKDNPAFKRENVGQIEIRRGSDAPLILRREGDKGWRIPAKFNAPADSHDVDMLLNKVFDAKRLGKPSTEDETTFPLYSLADDEAVQLRLCDSEGKELLAFLVGKVEDGSRDFIRLRGEGAQAGIFELANSTGSWDSLYSRLNLDGERRPDAQRWLDLSGFKAVPSGARLNGLIIEDDGVVIEARRDAADDKKWEITRPGRFAGDTVAIQGLVSAVEGLSAADIAGRDTDAASLGITGSKRKLTLEYTADNKTERAILAFGTVKDSQVTLHLTTATQGSMVYWVGDFVLQRVFRKLTEFVVLSDVGLLPAGRSAGRIRVVDGEKQMEAALESKKSPEEWVLLKPVQGKADTAQLSTLRNQLNVLRGARMAEKSDAAALGVDPSTAGRWIELGWTEPGEKKDGEDKPADVQKTVTLYFGQKQNNIVPALKRMAGQDDAVFWLAADAVDDLFVDPAGYHFYEVKVRQILISWKGKNARVTPKDAERTEEQARKLAAQVEERAKNGEEFVKLQAEFNEDSVPDNVYDVNPASGFVEPFKKLAASLLPGGVGSCDSEFGIHILKRVE